MSLAALPVDETIPTDSTELSESNHRVHNNRTSRMKGNQQFWQYAQSRDWPAVSSYWSSLLISDETHWPTFVKGEVPYTITPIQPLNAAGLRGEFLSRDSRYLKRHNFAMRVGYDGLHYHGYQRQKHRPIATVEGDLYDILRTTCFAAGRTDRGVNAISQVVNFATGNPDLTPEYFLDLIRQSEAFKQNKLRVYELYRVPKRFHARTSALWRRYMFLFPLSRTSKDLGEVFRFPHDIHLEPDSNYNIDLQRLNTILGRLKQQPLYYTAMSFLDDPHSSNATHKDICTLYEARAFEVDLPASGKAICVELVGTRFLRQMVRILVATALCHSWQATTTSTEQIDAPEDDVLLNIVNSKDRNQAEPPLPPYGLCFSGVGYDPVDLSIYQYMPKHQLAALQQEFNLVVKQ